MKINDIVESVIKVETSSWEPVMVTEGPSGRDCSRLIAKAKHHELRGILDLDTEKLYVWDAYDANHMDIADALGINLYKEVVLTPPLPDSFKDKISLDHTATNSFAGDSFTLFIRGVNSWERFMGIYKIFANDLKVVSKKYS